MEEALDEMEFLALSANRIAALEALADRPHTRGDLAASIGASQSTLGRILSDFEDRRWVTRTEEGYVATATGRLVAEGVGELLAVIETDRTLRPVLEWLPTGAMDFDLRHLRDASITAPSPTRPSAPLQRGLELLRDASVIKVCSHAFNEQSLSLIRERVVTESLSFEGVLSRAAIDALATDSALRADLETVAQATTATIRVHEAEIPVAIAITDDRVHLMLRDGAGVLRATVDTDDPDVLSWARETHDRYWNGATELDPEEL